LNGPYPPGCADWNGAAPGDENPVGQATFGIYNGESRQIYTREIYHSLTTLRSRALPSHTHSGRTRLVAGVLSDIRCDGSRMFGVALDDIMNLHVREADFADPRDCDGLVAVLDSYAADRVGGGRPLSVDVRTRLVPSLRDHPTALVLLAFFGEEPVGLAVCFFGLSTFRALPLLNIHDLAVLPPYRGKGVGRELLRAAEEHARRKGCCKLTLEVQDDNTRAQALYRSFGFGDFVVGDSASTRFLAKPLDPV
jgi:ribosomal protein S18 acetylase RimI-like enzyme